MAKCARRLYAVLMSCALGVAPTAWSLDVLRMGSFPIGGEVISRHDLPVREVSVPGANFTMKVDPNGDYFVDQLYVQYVKLRHPRSKYPLILIHGGGMTASTWEDTPDGRPGWQTYFLDKGYDVYMIDSVGRGRAGMSSAQLQTGEPIYPTAQGTWALARIGPPGSYNTDPAKRVGFPGVKFPLAAFDTLMRERVPSRGSAEAAATAKALSSLIQRICPCVLIAHSSGGPYALEAAVQYPDKIKAVVAIEPAGAPDPSKEAATGNVKSVPHLFLWGDFLGGDPIQQKAMPPVRAWSAALAGAGGVSEWVELPKHGITGNTHVMMMDSNSDVISGLVQEWFVRHGMMR